LLLVTAAVAAFAVGPASTTTEDAWAAGECFAPRAEVPWVGSISKRGYAYGWVDCPYQWSVHEAWVKLLNRAGNVLIQTYYPATSGNTLYYRATPDASCAGAYVRSHLWINTHGVHKSDTSGENPDCTY
jgi:hypothetical protein